MKQLGEGGMGVVYVGRHETLGRDVAVKVLQPELSRNADMVQRFFNEAQAATAIRNPGIVQVFDFGTTPDGRAYFVMELLEGETLTARIKQRRHSYEECCRLGRQIANVLQAAHATGITHRDLKPDNLVLVPDPEVIGGERVKVLDFGIAKLAGEAQASGVKTRTGLTMGTPDYMSPEQCRSASSASARSDIYSLGCILFEMACGRRPFVGEGMGDIVAAHLHVPPPHPQSLAPDMPAGLAGLIANMLAKQPDARPQTMTAVSQALDIILGAPGGPPARPSTPLPLPSPAPPPAFARAPTPLPVPEPSPPPPAFARAPTPLPMPPPVFERAPTPLPVPEPAIGRTPTPLPMPMPAQPAFERAPTPLPLPALLISPTSTTLGGAAGMSGTQPRAGTRRLPFVLGGLVIVGAATAIALVLATADSSSSSSSSSTKSPISYQDIPAPPPPATGAVPDAAVTSPVASPPAPIAVDAAAATEPPMTAGDLDAECRGLQVDRKWAELAQCAEKLKPLDPKRAAELATRAVEEAKAAPRIAAVEAALLAKNLLDAKAALDQISTDSVEHPSIKRKYDRAEAQAIAELVAQLERATDADCAKYNWLLGKARTSSPPRVAAEAARRTPCPPATCDADALAQNGQSQYTAGRLADSLASFEAAYACNPAVKWSEKALVLACNLGNIPKAKLHWKRLALYIRTRILSICVRNQITESMLDAP